MSDLEIFHILFTEFPFALFGSIVAGVLCAFLGVYVVSKRIVFVGAALTQGAVAGIAFSQLPFLSLEPIAGSIFFALVLVLLFAFFLERKEIPQDSILGASFVSAIAIRILMIQKSPVAEAAEVESVLKGDLLFVTPDQFVILLVVAVIILSVHLLFFKEFSFILFDPETASAQGYRSRRWEVIFYLTIGIAVSVAIRMVGDVFVFGFLVLPAITSLLLARKPARIFVLAVLLGIIPPIAGLYLAFRVDVPAGPATVATSFLLFCCAWTYSRFRK